MTMLNSNGVRHSENENVQKKKENGLRWWEMRMWWGLVGWWGDMEMGWGLVGGCIYACPYKLFLYVSL
jgi:hypothetical protein